jgi:single-strand DNA-binding protein
MADMNLVMLMGRAGKDAERISISDNFSYVKFSLATSERWLDKASGEWKEKTQWANIVVRNDHLMETAMKKVTKGTYLMVHGTLETRSYEKDGKTNYVTEVVIPKFGGVLNVITAKEQSSSSSGDRDHFPSAPPATPSKKGYPYNTLDDDIPF